MEKQKNYTITADCIRIIACFFVVFSHSTDMFVLWATLKGSSSWHIIYYLNTLFRIAVPIFVILSGYLLLHLENVSVLKLPMKHYKDI